MRIGSSLESERKSLVTILTKIERQVKKLFILKEYNIETEIDC